MINEVFPSYKKIVVFTGSFNPVTVAHFEIMSDAVEKTNADEGVFVTTNDKYLTKKSLLEVKVPSSFKLSEQTRGDMLRSLANENPKLGYWGNEIGGISANTYKTLVKIMKDKKKQYPGEDITLLFLFGGDKLPHVSHWDNADKMIGLCEYLVYTRNADLNAVIEKDLFLTAHRNRIHIMQTANEDLEDVSSTEVRRRFFAGEDYSKLMNKGPYRILQSFSPDDFPPVTPEDIVKAHILYGGRFGRGAARIQVYKNNKELFKKWAEPWLGDKERHGEAKVYDRSFTATAPTQSVPTVTGCVNSDCVDVAKRLIDEGFNPAILNPTSRVFPCGDYHNGANAQEESLCRASTLSHSLYRFGDTKYKCVREADVTIRPGVYPLDINHGGIYSPCVTFFRYGEDSYYALRDEKFDCPVVSVASKYNDDERAYLGSDGKLTADGRAIELNKIRTVFRIALDNGHDSMVLGAFGCGAYKLRPDEVAALFRQALNEPEFKNKFKKLIFAIYEGVPSPRKDPMGSDGKFAPFYNEFN